MKKLMQTGVSRRAVLASQLGLMTSVLIPGSVLAADDAKRTDVNFLGAHFGSYGYVMMYASSEMMTKYTKNIKGVVQETFGAVDNLKRLQRDKGLRTHTIAITSIPALYSAKMGQPKAMFPEPVKDMLNVFNTGNAVLWIATSDPSIKTPADLKGKRFDAGPYGNFMGFIGDKILQAYGVKDKVSSLLHTADQKAQYQNLVDGKVDAILTGSVAQGHEIVKYNSGVSQMLASRTLWPVTLEKSKVDEVHKLSGIPVVAYSVKAGLPNPKAPAYVGASFGLQTVASKEMPESLVYEVVKTTIAHIKEYGNYASPAKNGFTVETIAGLNVPVSDFHPGAVKAFREAGIKVGEENFK